MKKEPNQSPEGPCFEAGPGGCFKFQVQFASTRTWTTLGVFGFVAKSTVFDRDGRKWRAKGIAAPFRKSWWRVLLAHTVYNPSVSATLLWREPGAFELEELKQAYLQAVDQDDDTLTQFVEAAELKQRIAAASSFDGLVEVHRGRKPDHSQA